MVEVSPCGRRTSMPTGLASRDNTVSYGTSSVPCQHFQRTRPRNVGVTRDELARAHGLGKTDGNGGGAAQLAL